MWRCCVCDSSFNSHVLTEAQNRMNYFTSVGNRGVRITDSRDRGHGSEVVLCRLQASAHPAVAMDTRVGLLCLLRNEEKSKMTLCLSASGPVSVLCSFCDSLFFCYRLFWTHVFFMCLALSSFSFMARLKVLIVFLYSDSSDIWRTSQIEFEFL